RRQGIDASRRGPAPIQSRHRGTAVVILAAQHGDPGRTVAMNLFRVLEISGSALLAERLRAEIVSANLANAETTRTDSGGPYQRMHVVFGARPARASFGMMLASLAD